MESTSEDTLRVSSRPMGTSSPIQPKSFESIQIQMTQYRCRTLKRLRKLQEIVLKPSNSDLENISYYSVDEPDGNEPYGDFMSEFTRILTAYYATVANEEAAATNEGTAATNVETVMSPKTSKKGKKKKTISTPLQQTASCSTTYTISSRKKKTPLFSRVAVVNNSLKPKEASVRRLAAPGEQVLSMRGSPLDIGHSAASCKMMFPLSDGRTIAVSADPSFDSSSFELPPVDMKTKDALKKLVKLGQKLLRSSDDSE